MYKNVSSVENTVFSRCLEPFNKEESHEVEEEYENCCCQLQKKNSITGFSEIAKSKRYLRRVTKLFVYFICTVGFFYHIWQFLQLYLTYPTTLDITEEYPDSFSAPAVTICNRNRLLRQAYCKTYPDTCTWQNTTWEEFCDTYRKQCPEIKPQDFNFGIPDSSVPLRVLGSNVVLNAVGPQKPSDLIMGCGYGDPEYHNHCNSSSMIQVAKGGLPYKCFSIFSLLGMPYEEPLNFNSKSECRVVLDMHPEEYINNNDLVQAWVVLHDPRKLVNPMIEGVTLTAGKLYQLHTYMEKRESLPPPYASKCMDYLKKWKENGGYGPLSKKDCVDLCKIKAVNDEYGCVGRTMTYPNNYNICIQSAHDATPDVNRMCFSSCRDACEETSYHVTAEPLVDLKIWCNSTDEHCKHRKLTFSVTFTRMTVQKFKLIPKFESVELFSYIGGYLGLWLGISLASAFDIGEMIYDLIAYLRLRGKRLQKTTMPVEQFQHHTVLKKRRKIVKRETLY